MAFSDHIGRVVRKSRSPGMSALSGRKYPDLSVTLIATERVALVDKVSTRCMESGTAWLPELESLECRSLSLVRLRPHQH